jgi:choline dehydrogenase-like flavoprotein
MSAKKTDVLVIGSGFGAAAPALRLSEAGFGVTILEKGPNIDAPGDFKQTQDPAYFLNYFKSTEGDNISMSFIEGLGGGSGFYEMISLRAPSPAFEQEDEWGRRVWPAGIDRATLDPYFEMAERMLHVQQIPVDRIPKNGLIFSKMMKNLGYSCDRSRYAYIPGRCVGSGFCAYGCLYGAKQSLHFNYLPRASEAGARLLTGIEVRSIRQLGDVLGTAREGELADIPYRYEVRARNLETGENVRYRCRLLLLGAGTVGTGLLLEGSRDRLPGLSRALGRRLAFNGGVKAVGLLSDEWPDGDMFTGQSQPGMISYEFMESHGVTVSTAKPLPLQAIAAARFRLSGEGPTPSHFGAAHMELMKQLRRRVIVLFALGLTPPSARLELDDGRPRLSLELTPGLRAYHTRTKELLQSILIRNGCRPLDLEFVDGKGMPREDIFFSTAHQVGSCPMADSKSLGVVDVTGEAFDLPGLYVTDGAAIPGSIAVSTSLTILANAERIAEGILRRYRATARRAA